MEGINSTKNHNRIDEDESLLDPVTYDYIKNTYDSGATQLNLQNHGMNSQWGPVLQKFLQKASSIELVDLASNNLGDEGLDYICDELINNVTVRDFDISGNNIQTVGANAIARVLETNRTLRKLKISHNALTDLDAEGILSTLRENNTLEQLNMRSNRLSDTGAHQIAEMLTLNSTLKSLDFSWNDFKDDGINEIFKGMQCHPSIEELVLSGNQLRDKNITVFADSVRGKTLRMVDFSDNFLTDAATRTISRFINANPQLKTAKLGNNLITSIGTVYLLDSIAAYRHCTIAHVDLAGLNCDHNIRTAFEKVQASKKNFLLTGVTGVGMYGMSPMSLLDKYITKNELHENLSNA